MRLTTTENRPATPDADMLRPCPGLRAKLATVALPDVPAASIPNGESMGFDAILLAFKGLRDPSQQFAARSGTLDATDYARGHAALSADEQRAALAAHHRDAMARIERRYHVDREDVDENAGQLGILAAVEPEDEDEQDADRRDGLGKAVRA